MPSRLLRHVHEKWMIQESASGGYYCAACGEAANQDGSPIATPAADVDPEVATDEFIQWLEEELGVALDAAQRAVHSYAYLVWAQGYEAHLSYTQTEIPRPKNPYRTEAQ